MRIEVVNLLRGIKAIVNWWREINEGITRGEPSTDYIHKEYSKGMRKKKIPSSISTAIEPPQEFPGGRPRHVTSYLGLGLSA